MKEFISPHRLAGVASHTGVLLALSGGADSRLLLDLLSDDAKEHGYTLQLAHVHHGIRGSEADRDEQFCRELSAHYHCPLHVLHADVPALAAQSGESLEMVGRRVRYRYFASLMEQHDLPLLATAHHADDNLETMLLRLASGTSATGLAGIAPVQRFGNGHLVRPILNATRRRVIELCRDRQLSYVQDSTNADTAYGRNRVRADVVPALEQLAPGIHQRALRTAAYLREDDAYLHQLADAARQDATTPHGTLHLSALRALPSPVLRRLLLHTLHEHASEESRIQGCHLDALCHLVACAHGSTDLPGGLCAVADGDELRLTPRSAPSSPPPALSLPLCSGTHSLPSLGVTLRVEQIREDETQSEQNANLRKNPQNVYTPFIHDTLTFDTIDHEAYFRLRLDGDQLLMGGMHRKIRKLQNAAGMPPSLRERLPLLCDSRGVLWVPFIGRRDALPDATPTTRWRVSIDVAPAPFYENDQHHRIQ